MTHLNALTPASRALIVQALREKAGADRERAGRASLERVAADFVRQADHAMMLAALFEGARAVTVEG